MPIGQGVSMTALQLASIYQTIANGGVRVPPRIVQSVTGGSTRRPPQPPRVMSQSAADQLRQMLESVTGVDGTAKAVQIAGYRIGGKTGTAQRANPACSCYSGGGYYHTFVGVAPLGITAVRGRRDRDRSHRGAQRSEPAVRDHHGPDPAVEERAAVDRLTRRV